VIDRLTATAIDKVPPGHDNQYGYGRLNIEAALKVTFASAPPPRNTPANTSPFLPAPPACSTTAASPDTGDTTSVIILVTAIVLAFAIAVAAGLTVGRRTRPRR
jgi:hypothetical protein